MVRCLYCIPPKWVELGILTDATYFHSALSSRSQALTFSNHWSLNGVYSAGLVYIIAATMTLGTTALTVQQINQLTRKSRNRSTYGRIIRILVDSAALQSVPCLIQGILVLLYYRIPGLESNCNTLAIAIREVSSLVQTISVPLTVSIEAVYYYL